MTVPRSAGIFAPALPSCTIGDVMQYEMDSIIRPSTQAPVFWDINDSLRQLYLDDPRPWLVGFSGGGRRLCWQSNNTFELRL